MLLIVLIFVIAVAATIVLAKKRFKSLEQPVSKVQEKTSVKVTSHEPIVDLPVEKAAEAIAENTIKPKIKKVKKTANKGSQSKTKNKK